MAILSSSVKGCLAFLYISASSIEHCYAAKYLKNNHVAGSDDLMKNIKNTSKRDAYKNHMVHQSQTRAIGRTDFSDKNRKHRFLQDWSEHKWLQLGNDITGEEDNDYSGTAVATSGDGTTVVIGSPYAGHTRVFRLIDTVWFRLGQEIKGGVPGDFSGGSVALSTDGNIVAIGARNHDNSQMNAIENGIVIVYEIVDGNWVQLGDGIEGLNDNDRLGHTLSLSSDGLTVAAGAYNDSRDGMEAGAVTIASFVNGSWEVMGSPIIFEWSGYSVSLNGEGNMVAIGAKDSDVTGVNSGQVRVFQFDENNEWAQMGFDVDVDADGDAAGDEFGSSLSLSDDGSTLAAGAFSNNNGYVHVYRLDTENSTWKKIGQKIIGGAQSISLSSDGNTLAVGRPRMAKIFQLSTEESWVQVGEDLVSGNDQDNFGESLSLSDDGMTVVIGAPLSSLNGQWSGHVSVFQLVKETESPSSAPSTAPSLTHTISPTSSPTSSPSLAPFVPSAEPQPQDPRDRDLPEESSSVLLYVTIVVIVLFALLIFGVRTCKRKKAEDSGKNDEQVALKV